MERNRQGLRNILLLVLLACVLLYTWSSSYALGSRAQRAGNHLLAKVWYGIAAHSGDPRAQSNLSGLYAEGLGGTKDDKLAAYWAQKAAAAGISEARFNLSNMYEAGRGVPRDIRKAVALLEALALEHHADAAFNLGHVHATGRDDYPQDFERAVYWYRMSAEQGFPAAQHNLGLLYLQGSGVPRDVAVAMDWIWKAAEQDNRRAQLDYGLMRMLGVGAPANAQEAKMWLARAAQDPVVLQLLKTRLAQLRCVQLTGGSCGLTPRTAGN